MQANRPHGGNGAKGTNGTGIRAKRRHLRAIFKEGLEAALRADPAVLEKCTPKTGAGLFVRGLVLEAGKGKTTSIRTLMSLVDWEPDENDEEILDETRWDWNAEGAWDTMPEAGPEESEPAEEEEGPAKKELRRRLNRLIEVGDHERVARVVEAMRQAVTDDASPAKAAASP
jgi:hypothetical protein